MTGAADDRRDFFISFNRADRDWATWVAWALEEAGYSVFFQDWDFRGNFVEHMGRAHARAQRTLAVLSDHYVGSDFTLAEWSARFAQDPAAREDRLVPVKVGPIADEGILGPLVYADLTGCDEEEARSRLLGRVRKAVDASYRAKPQARPGFPGGPSREVPEKPSFPQMERQQPPGAGEQEAAPAARAGIGSYRPPDPGASVVARSVPVPTGRGLSGLHIVLILVVLIAVGGALLAGGLFGKRVTSTGGVAAGGDISGSTITVGPGAPSPPPVPPGR
jgi:hypothetical protein